MYNDCPEEKRTTLEANIILDEIRLGNPVIHDCAIITGNLGPLSAEMTKDEHGRNIVKSSIKITNSVFQGKIIFEDTIFKEAVEFRETSFNEDVNFVGSIFCQQCIFEGSHFFGITNFSCRKKSNPRIYRRAHFLGQSDFKRTHFESADFSYVVFEQSAEFSSQNSGEDTHNRSIFKGNYTFFEGTKFKLLAIFEECEFENEIQFRGAQFSREAYFNNAKFGRYTNFMEVEFNNNTYFNGATFSGAAAFAESIFKKDADFRKVTFNGDYGNFRAAQFSGEFVSFSNAKFRNLCDQAMACKKARRQLEGSGSRGEADRNFFMEMEAKRKLKGIIKINNKTSRLLMQSTMKISSEFMDEFKSENLGWIERLWIVIHFTLYNLDGFKILLKKTSDDINAGKFLIGRLKILIKFLWHNLIEFIVFRHIFGGYGIFWQWILIWWLFFAIVFGFVYRYYFGGIGDAICFWQCVYFSILVLFTRGLGNYQLSLNIISLEDKVVTFEIILGIVMLGIFLASITRKYMR